jgi:hypothetical protein
MVSFSKVSPPKPCIHLSSPPYTTCSAHLILLDLITRIIYGEQYRSLCYTLCSFLHSPVTSTLLDPNIHLNTILSNTCSLPSILPQHEWPSFIPIQNRQAKLWFSIS